MKFIALFEALTNKDIALVGGKNASLGEMLRHLAPQGVPIPIGFVITALAYKDHIQRNNLSQEITVLLSRIDKEDVPSLQAAGQQIRTLIENAPLSNDLIAEISEAYQNLETRCGPQLSVAIRSSATAEDLPTASFAGQQETYLNVSGIQNVLACIPQAFASLFTDRAIAYRIDQGFGNDDVALSLGVQQMIRSDLATSGVMFTLDTESGFSDVIYITSSYGLGETIVQGAVNPDEYYVHKPTLKLGYKPLLKKRLGSKQIKMVYAQNKQSPLTTIPVDKQEQLKFSLSDDELLTLARYALLIEEHYSQLAGRPVPMDIEWAKDGLSNKLFIVQARPETVHSQAQKNSTPGSTPGQTHEKITASYFKLDATQARQARKIITGASIGKKIVAGKARVIKTSSDMHLLEPGEILVTIMTNPDWEPIMKKAAGIITDRGGRTCHAAIISRELGIAAIVGTGNATQKIKTGDILTLDCSTGEIATVYEGTLAFSCQQVPLVRTQQHELDKNRAQLMINVGHPDEVFSLAGLPCDGVGLARLEFIINTSICIHPMALVHPESITDKQEREIFDRLTIMYQDKKQYFIDTVAQEVGTIAAAFYPRPVIVRLSDFKSNEYQKLLGGALFEKPEENPMIGFRGASRYTHPAYQEAFILECKALKKVRDEMGLDNLIVMIPFVRTVDEAKKVIAFMETQGLGRQQNICLEASGAMPHALKPLELYMMCEIPSNVILIDEFCKLFDGFSIGSNDLTQMTLGIDRDSEQMASQFDERNQAVMWMIEHAIRGARAAGKKIGICGQAPSDYPEIIKQLESWGISSISLSPDSFITLLAREM